MADRYPIQFGEFAQRIRRVLGIRGPIDAALDRVASPTVLLADASDKPFALDPAWASGFITETAAAGQQTTIAISNQGPSGSVFLLDGLYLAAGAAGGRIEISRSGVLQTDGTISQTKTLADMSTSCLGLTTALNVPVRLTAWTTAPAATGGAIGEELRALTTSTFYPVRAMLRPQEVIYVKSQTVAQLLALACFGRFYTQAGSE